MACRDLCPVLEGGQRSVEWGARNLRAEVFQSMLYRCELLCIHIFRYSILSR